VIFYRISIEIVIADKNKENNIKRIMDENYLTIEKFKIENII
jgi:hypothetical protein